jgi:hypothetical protein
MRLGSSYFLATVLAVGVVASTLAQDKAVYMVGGFALGGKVKFDSEPYRKYECSPSEQFEGFIWCQSSRDERERRGTFKAYYGMLHSNDGTVLYTNRFQEPAFWRDDEFGEDINWYSRKLGEQPKILQMPSRLTLPDAIIAVWGKVVLEPLDDESRKVLGEGKIVAKRGIFIDFVGNYVRSVREGLPLYRITGGAGFVWAGSKKDGQGTLRFLAINPSLFYPPSSPPSTNQY